MRGAFRHRNKRPTQDRHGNPLRFRATEFEARVIQHEVDHLDGILFIDLADPKTLHMETPADREEAPAE